MIEKDLAIPIRCAEGKHEDYEDGESLAIIIANQ